MKPYKRNIVRVAFWGMVLVLGMMAGSASAQDAGKLSHLETLTFDGLDRDYYLHIPANAQTGEAMPLVIVLHPSFSSAGAAEVLTDMDAAADEYGFMVVYPDSSNGVWGEDSRPEDEQDYVVETDDIGFMTALIDELAATHNADPNHVSIVGWGNGGLMAYRLGCEIPDRIENIVAVGSLMWEYHIEGCSPTADAPVNVLVMHGSVDEVYTYNTHPYETLLGGTSPQPIIMGLGDTMNFWADRESCDLEAMPTETESDAFVYPNCAKGAVVASYDVQGIAQHWLRDGENVVNQYGIATADIVSRFVMGDSAWAIEQPAVPEEPARGYILYVPKSYDPSQPAPVVIGLHGRFGTGVGMASGTGFNQKAEDEGFIVVYPDGLSKEWNYSRDVPYFETPAHDDTLLMKRILDELDQDLNIDRSRVYAYGLSNGGFMAQRLGCSAPDVFAAVASVAATGYAGIEIHCENNIPIPIMFIHGTDDNNVPWNGTPQQLGNGQTLYLTMPMSDTVGFWAANDGCSEEPTAEDLPVLGNSPGTAVRVVTFANCADDTSLMVYAVVGGGHNWPGKPSDAPAQLVGRVNQDFQPVDVIWDFFSQYSLDQ